MSQSSTVADKNTTTFQIWRVPPDLKSRFKTRCGEDKRTMREVVLEFLAKYAARK